MKKITLIIGIILFVWAAIFFGMLVWENFRGIGPIVQAPPGDIGDIIDDLPKGDDGNPLPPGKNSTDFPLQLPDSFAISIFAKDLPGVRVMVEDSFGNIWVSQKKEGVVTLLEIENGRVVNQNAIFRNLNGPHGLVFDPEDPTMLYIAEEDKVSRVRVYSEGTLEKIMDLPSGKGHSTRTLMFHPDGRLLTSVGSSCNVCKEEDWRRAKIIVSDKDGNNPGIFASGLRNAVFMTLHPETKEVWVTEMGRDLLGDDTPPDEINIVREGGNYGWPICYGKNIHDTDFDKNTYIRNPCMDPFEISSYIDLQAHSAPLGLTFVPKEGWPEDMQHDLLVAYHGSWNRSEPTGYKIMRFKLDEEGNYEGREDLISGWLQGNRTFGRPVDILIQPDGVMYISDDKAKLIYRLMYMGLE